MKAQTRTRLALFGGTAALVIAVGGVGIAPASGITTTSPSESVTQAPPAPGASTGRPDAGQPGGGGGHLARLTGCISGLDC
jgi:hypothetical protein